MSLDTIAIDIMGALQTLCATIPGVQAPQPSIYPTSIATTNGQPFAMTVLRSGEGWQKGAGYSYGAYIYGVLVFLDPIAQSDIPSHVVDGAQMYQQFVNVFIKSTNTPLFNPGAYQATIQSGPDGPHISGSAPGPQAALVFGGTPWYGFELQVPVRWQGPQV
jgi:hypothetical protein